VKKQNSLQTACFAYRSTPNYLVKKVQAKIGGAQKNIGLVSIVLCNVLNTTWGKFLYGMFI